ncbi:MAG: dual specificity protein phosphatase family protein [Acidobacteria bacterium]|nr:dual specificity protein phosphatase family protein [Acidobacteriota bacterium]
MQPKVFWVVGPWCGRLGILPRPRGGDWLEDETLAWREAGIDLVVSLLEPEEEAQFVLQGEAAATAASGIDFRPFPIPDRGVPVSRESVADLADEITSALETGRNVAVHCRQGIGRSGLIVGGVLVAAGKDLDTALEAIKESRGVEVPETEEQRRWLSDFASWLSSTRPVRRAAAAGKRRGTTNSGPGRP